MASDVRRRLKDIIDSAIQRGWRIEEKKKGLCFKHGSKGIYHVHNTVSDTRALLNIEKALLRIEAGRPAGAH